MGRLNVGVYFIEAVDKKIDHTENDRRALIGFRVVGIATLCWVEDWQSTPINMRGGGGGGVGL